MERVTFNFTPKTGPKGKPLNPLWEKADGIATKVSIPTKQILRMLKKSEFAVERALIDLGEAQGVKSKKALFIYLYKKYL